MNKSTKKILIPLEKAPKTYLNALKEVGLTPVCAFSPKNLNEFSGLLLTGGGDVCPSFYSSEIKSSNVNVFRDLNELKLLDYFVNNGLPVLGVCRGLQLINVFFNGTLKNVDGHKGSSGDLLHPVLTYPEGFLSGLTEVNSYHSQAIDDLCKNAVITAVSYDGIIEGLKIGDKVIAVQFHPERMEDFALRKVYGEFAKLING